MKLKSIKRNGQGVLEKRQLVISGFAPEQRSAYGVRAGTNEQNERYLQGYAAVYNSPSKVIGEFVSIDGGEPQYREFIETLLPGCFDSAIADPNLNCIHSIDHNFEKMVSRSRSGTLKLELDTFGLKYTSLMPRNVTYANDVYELVQRGDYTDSSFIFEMAEDESEDYWEEKDGMFYRYIRKVSAIYDCSTVVNGAYYFSNPQTQVMARTYSQVLDQVKREEQQVEPEKLEIVSPQPEPVIDGRGEIEKLEIELFLLQHTN